MTTKQYRRALEELGLSQGAAAKYLGVTARTSQNWALGASAVHPCADRLLRLLLIGKITPTISNDRLETFHILSSMWRVEG